jgi:hypothetical protein
MRGNMLRLTSISTRLSNMKQHPQGFTRIYQLKKTNKGKYTGWMDRHMNSKENPAVLTAYFLLKLITTAFTMVI